MLDCEFVDKQKVVLLSRLTRKRIILNDNGQQALSHSSGDLTKIEFALKRIEEGQYGLCADCGITINRKRLETFPETPFCVDCAQ